MIQFKTCNFCSVEKPKTEFHKNTHSKDGLTHKCKSCAKWYSIMRADHVREYSKRRREEVNFRAQSLYKNAKRRAIENNLVFDLSLLRIEIRLIIGTCEGSGVKFDMKSHDDNWYNPYAPSIDKINPFGGYTDFNTRVVCNAYNLGKNQMSHEEYVAFCKTVAEFNS